MCRELEKMRKEVAEEAAAEAAKIARRKFSLESALDMIADGSLTYEQIAKFSKLTVEEVTALASGKTA